MRLQIPEMIVLEVILCYLCAHTLIYLWAFQPTPWFASWFPSRKVKTTAVAF